MSIFHAWEMTDNGDDTHGWQCSRCLTKLPVQFVLSYSEHPIPVPSHLELMKSMIPINCKESLVREVLIK